MSRTLSLRSRLALLSFFAGVLPTLGLLLLLEMMGRPLVSELSSLLSEQAKSETAKIGGDVYVLCKTMQNALQSQINNHLGIARHVVSQRGEIALGHEEVEWRAVNQLTHEEQRVRLPRLLVGKEWLGQNRDPRTPTPLVDEVQSLVGDTVTVFQRMNERGDMLRVATNVLDDSGQRAIGTFIPARTAQGQENPVVTEVLAGRRFLGRAFVVNAWHITGYEPIFDGARRVIGMVYVGVRQDSLLKPVREGLVSMTVGKSGYVWAAMASGDQAGVLAISPRGARDGENVLRSADAAERESFKDLIARGLSTKGGAVEHVEHKVVEKGGTRPLLTAVTYFEPWDWVIGATAYQEDYLAGAQAVNATLGRITRWAVGGALFVLLLVVSFTLVAVSRMLRPLARLVRAAESIASGDLRQDLSEGWRDDEVGKVAKSFAQMTAGLRQIAEGIHESVGALNEAVGQMGSSAGEQNNAITRQATALHETQVTAEEIKQVSLMAAQKAEAVLQGTTRADEASRAGEVAVEQTMTGLREARDQVDEIAKKIHELEGKARQVGSITGSVKNLADQSNMLALNAAIEAVRSGEHGKGFAVVAREVRSLADQSIQATERVGEILEGINAAIGMTVSISENGVKKMESGLEQAKVSGDNLQQLATIIQENVAAVRQIAAAVGQQNAGIAQIFSAVTDQNKMMEETVKRLEASNATVATLRKVAEKISTLAQAYKV